MIPLTLAEQITAYASELEKNLGAQDLQVKIDDCRSMEKKLLEHINYLKQLTVSYQLFKSDLMTDPTNLLTLQSLDRKFKHTSTILATVKKIWKEHKEALRQADCFTSLLHHLKECNEDFFQHLKQYWSSWEQKIRIDFAVDTHLLNGIAHIPGQSDLYFDYKDELKQFNTLVGHLPTSSEDIVTIKQLAKQLTQLREKMKFDVPKSVQLFFAKFGTSTTVVSLQDLSPEVFEWLNNNNLSKSFTVQRQWNSK